FNFYCSTNNNRICGGISSSYHCKHLSNLIDEAIKQFGIDTVADFMKIDGDVKDSSELTGKMSGNIVKEHSGEIFTRFLEYLKFLEAPSSNQHIPEMSWFV
ncbi:MAG: hypothetical protein GY754_25120, partial [bacterium]|nr:hypothetical protein [bacterium]